MRFLLDQNVSIAAAQPLQSIYHDHEFDHAYAKGLAELKDIPLFQELAMQGYDAIITKDRGQLSDNDERRALLTSGLHWIGHRAKRHKGLRGIAIETATLIAGMTFVLDDWRDRPHVYSLKGIEAEGGQRVKVSATELAKWKNT